MPPEIKTDREKMLDGVMSIIEERGDIAVSARSVAERLGISTQPIYREFGDMDNVRRAAAERGWEIFAEYINGDATDQSVKYVMFECERKNLFNFLFRGRNCEYDGLDDMAHKLVDGTEIIERLQKITGLNNEQTYRMHLFVWMAMHGLASMTADNSVRLSRDELEKFTVDITRAVSAYIKSQSGDKA